MSGERVVLNLKSVLTVNQDDGPFQTPEEAFHAMNAVIEKWQKERWFLLTKPDPVNPNYPVFYEGVGGKWMK